MGAHWLDAFSLVIGTALMLSAALATYDLILQIATVLNVFGSAQSKPISARSVIGQTFFALTMIGLAILFLAWLPMDKPHLVKGAKRSTSESVAGADALGFVH